MNTVGEIVPKRDPLRREEMVFSPIALQKVIEFPLRSDLNGTATYVLLTTVPALPLPLLQALQDRMAYCSRPSSTQFIGVFHLCDGFMNAIERNYAGDVPLPAEFATGNQPPVAEVGFVARSSAPGQPSPSDTLVQVSRMYFSKNRLCLFQLFPV